MFYPKTKRIEHLAGKYPNRIKELESIFNQKSNIYIDFANAIRWQDKLGWHIDLKRLKQFLDSFNNVNEVKFYNGLLEGDKNSLEILNQSKKAGYFVREKPVKKLSLSIDVSSIPKDSPNILKDFIRHPLLKKLKIETVEHLNNELQELNKRGVYYLEDLKCNFDVEIGTDMLLDHKSNEVENFILWSGDSDFADPINQLLEDGKKCMLFTTVRRTSSELNNLRGKGLLVFEIQKIKNFICWKREMNI